MTGATTCSPATRRGVRCTFCHGPFAPQDGPFSCSGCGAYLHEGCWFEAARCPSLGCAGPGRRRSPRPPGATRPSYRWAIGASLHVVALGVLLSIGLAAQPGGSDWLLATALLFGWGLLLSALRRAAELDAPWLLVVSGFAAGALLPILAALAEVVGRNF